MKVSIITVVYNNCRTIEDAIKSVTGQSHKEIEYIIIDGNSTDGTIDIIKKYDNKMAIFVSEPDKGIYDAMNKGIAKASGDLIGILNSDDIYADNNVVADVVENFELDISTDIVYGDLVYVKSDNVNKIVRNWVSKEYSENFFENGNVPPHPSLFVRRAVYEKVGLFNLQYKLAADYEFMLRSFKSKLFKIKYVKRLIVKMRLGGATNKSVNNILKGNKEIIQSWKNNGYSLPLALIPLRIIKRIAQFFP